MMVNPDIRKRVLAVRPHLYGLGLTALYKHLWKVWTSFAAGEYTKAFTFYT